MFFVMLSVLLQVVRLLPLRAEPTPDQPADDEPRYTADDVEAAIRAALQAPASDTQPDQTLTIAGLQAEIQTLTATVAALPAQMQPPPPQPRYPFQAGEVPWTTDAGLPYDAAAEREAVTAAAAHRAQFRDRNAPPPPPPTFQTGREVPITPSEGDDNLTPYQQQEATRRRWEQDDEQRRRDERGRFVAE